MALLIFADFKWVQFGPLTHIHVPWVFFNQFLYLSVFAVINTVHCKPG